MSDCRVSCSTAYLYRVSSLFICSALSNRAQHSGRKVWPAIPCGPPQNILVFDPNLYHIYILPDQILVHSKLNVGPDALNKFIPTFHGAWPGLVVCSVFNFKQPIAHQDVHVFNVYGRTDRKRCEDLLFKTDLKLLWGEPGPKLCLSARIFRRSWSSDNQGSLGFEEGQIQDL